MVVYNLLDKWGSLSEDSNRYYVVKNEPRVREDTAVSDSGGILDGIVSRQQQFVVSVVRN